MHTISVREWKKQFLANMHLAINPNKGVEDYKEKLKEKDLEQDVLYRQIGKLSTQIEWAKKNLKNLDLNIKRKLISNDETLSVSSQCELLSFSRSAYYYESKTVISIEQVKILEEITAIYEEYPFYGHRPIYKELQGKGIKVGRDRVLKYMNNLNLKPIFSNRKTTQRNMKDPVYPYLLKNRDISRPNQVWAADITYLPMERGFCYFVGIIDWYTRKILSYRISNTLDRQFCLEALEEACLNHGQPEIFNTDQGSQFTSHDFTRALKEKGILVSMDSVGRWADNIIIERFFRTLKYENVYLWRYETIRETKISIKNYINFYNSKRRHSTLNYQTPDQAYEKYHLVA